jgi:hypothetical protein
MPSMMNRIEQAARAASVGIDTALAERDNAVLETLHCEVCDEDFTRTVVRGRKPKVCPACKAQAEAEHTPRVSKGTGAERLDRDEIVLTCIEYGITPRIAIPFMLAGETPPHGTDEWTFKQTKIINSFDPLVTDGDTDSTVDIHGLNLYKIPTL